MAYTPDAACLGCGYNLHGIESGICPECGRRFDRADSSTYAGLNRGSSWRLWAQPPSMVEVVAAVGTSALILIATSAPPEPSIHNLGIPLFCGWPLWLSMVLVYFRRIKCCHRERREPHDTAVESRPRSRARWIAFPMLMAIAVSVLIYPWPLVFRFHLSKSAFDQAVIDYEAGNLKTPCRVGAYKVQSVVRYEGFLHFITNGSSGEYQGFEFDPLGWWIDFDLSRGGMSVAKGWYAIQH